MTKLPAKNKYRNEPVWIDGIKFQSRAEGRRYSELKLLERAGEISHLELQPPFKFTERGRTIFTYKGDFQYRDVKTGDLVLEDVKSPASSTNSTYRLKKKLIEARYYPLKIQEVGL